jgi:hypothetical protein
MKNFYITFCAFASLSLSLQLKAQDVLPVNGTDFWLGFMNNYEVEPFQESLDIFITSDVATSGSVTIGGMGWSELFITTPGQTTIVTIPNEIGEVFTDGEVDLKGIHLTSVDPVSVYAINFNGYSADATRILPASNITENYMIMSYEGISGFDYPSEALIVATTDSSIVEITTAATLASGQSAGSTFQISMNAGEVYQIKSSGDFSDLTGTVIREVNPENDFSALAVFAGASCSLIPTNCYACDHLYEQIDPLESWGTIFPIPPTTPATGYTIRVLASGDDTTVEIDNQTYNLDAGEFFTLNNVSDAKCVVSNAPVSVGYFMEGVTCVGYGDPSFTIAADIHQKVDGFTFSTVESEVITDHMLAVIISDFDSLNLYMDGVQVSPSLFIPFDECSDQLYANFPVTAGTHQLSMAEGSGFIAYAYGTGSAESYMFTAASTLYFEQGFPVSISESTQHSYQVKIYPNPAENVLEITSSIFKGENISIEISDPTGMTSECKVLNRNRERASLDISSLPNGIYILKCSSSLGSISERFIKK